jgi:hypothetical protein
MIVVRVELWSAIDGTKRELARMHMNNVGDERDPDWYCAGMAQFYEGQWRDTHLNPCQPTHWHELPKLLPYD